MKIRNLTLTVLLSVLVIFGACKKDDEGSGDPGGSAGTMTLKVDGTSWNASLAVQAINTNGVINITGSDSNAGQGSVILYGVSAPGTYAVGPAGSNPGNMLRWTEGLGQNDSYMASNVLGTGSVTINTLTATGVSGTFYFDGYNTAQTKKTITEGTFNANF